MWAITLDYGRGMWEIRRLISPPLPQSSHSPVAATVVRVDDVVHGRSGLEGMEVVVEIVVGGVGTWREGSTKKET